MGRGTLNVLKTALTTETFALCWTLDETGNWAGFRQDGTGSGWDLIQSRTANEVNEITDIDNTVGAGWATPAYDPAGNMTTIPTAKPPGWSDMSVADWSGLSVDNWESLPVDGSPDTYTATYDAWNRLVKLVDTASTDTVAEYEYDARRYRMVVKTYVSGSLDETRHIYYTDGWQAIEERLGTATDPDRQYLWGLRYIDDLILRDRDTNANGTLDERLYALQDGNWNVIALTDQNGDVQERYAYTAYGVPLFLSTSFGELASSNYDWETLYCSYRYETASGLHSVRWRYLSPLLGIWLTRDIATDALYLYVEGNPIVLLDPSGMQGFGPPPQFGPAISAYEIQQSEEWFKLRTYGKPNIGLGRGTYHKSEHEIVFIVSGERGKNAKLLQNQIFEDLLKFKHFNPGNSVAQVRLSGNVAEFNMNESTWAGWGSDFLNSDWVPVRIKSDPATMSLEGTTLFGHMLDGKRWWHVHVTRGNFCDSKVTITTTSIDRQVGSLNDWGAWFAGEDEQLKVWDIYLENIEKAYGGTRESMWHGKWDLGTKKFPHFSE